MKAVILDGEWDPRPEYECSETEADTHKSNNGSQTWKHPALHIENREKPTPESDEVLVKVRYTGVCGSDISMTHADGDRYMHYSAYVNLPNVIGHEFSGEVVETGEDVQSFSKGDLVTSEVTSYCGRCHMCRNGFNGHCENFEQLGFTIPGAFAEYVAVPEILLWDVSPLEKAYKSKDDILKAAATIEPTTITYNGLFGRAEGIRPGDYYAFHGVGPIGLTGMNVARAAGAGAVIAFEPSDERRDLARELGFEYVFNPVETDPTQAVAQVTDGMGVDVHVETAGAVAQTYPAIDETLAETANVVHISNAGEPASVDLRQYQANAAQVYGAEGHTGDRIFTGVIRLMAAGKLDNLPLVTSIFDLEEADTAIEQASKRVDGKVLIEV
ncbi:scyllo-inosose 3-dehydrogenase [Haladaptatus pallidirubidus]|nr:scyllo-inosose 3-dehydrogenase [Haladaptatus pallidirubidus]